MNDPSLLKIKTRPKWYFLPSYIFFDETNKKIASIKYPVIAKMFSINRALLIFENEEYLILDSLGVVTMIGKNRFISTFLKKGDNKILELSYGILESSEEYKVKHLEKNLEYRLKLVKFGTWDIFFDNEKIGTLKNKELIRRRASIELNQPIPLIVQFLMIWGSNNVQDVRLK